MNTDILAQLHIAHTLRCDENELPAHGSPSSLDHHGHARGTIDRVHEDVEFVEAADRAAHGLPDGEQQADGGERLFTTRKRLRFAARVGSSGEVRLDLDVEFFAFVVDDCLAAELALAQQVPEHDPSARGDELAEHLPAMSAGVEGGFESLWDTLADEIIHKQQGMTDLYKTTHFRHFPVSVLVLHFCLTPRHDNFLACTSSSAQSMIVILVEFLESLV